MKVTNQFDKVRLKQKKLVWFIDYWNIQDNSWTSH